MWTRTANGRVLHFYLAGINNQNFLMRDKETGTWWQQITGKAIYGPLKGSALELVASDELTFGQWKSEVSDGKVLAPVAKFTKEYDANWEPEVAKLPVVISFPGTELKSRDVVVGIEIGGAARAYPWDSVVKQAPIVDHLHGTPLLLVVGKDKKSFRVFVGRVDGKETEFFLKSETKDWTLLDTATNSEWNFQGCATSGPSQGKCLDRVPALKDYWFDWRNYHHDTTIYKH
ncbi:MAG: DUF3179 domain-containing protein [Acidobacteria bacterium]|nr:DUF3179 domain-containing protein [Acidobacteriota bacterium]